MLNKDNKGQTENLVETRSRKNEKKKKNDIILRNILNIGKIKQKQQTEKNNNVKGTSERRSRSRVRRQNVNHGDKTSTSDERQNKTSEGVFSTINQQGRSPSSLMIRSQSVQNSGKKSRNNNYENVAIQPDDHEDIVDTIEDNEAQSKSKRNDSRSVSRNSSKRKRTREFRSTKYNRRSDLPVVQITTKVTEYSFGGCGIFGMNRQVESETKSSETKVKQGKIPTNRKYEKKEMKPVEKDELDFKMQKFQESYSNAFDHLNNNNELPEYSDMLYHSFSSENLENAKSTSKTYILHGVEENSDFQEPVSRVSSESVSASLENLANRRRVLQERSNVLGLVDNTGQTSAHLTLFHTGIGLWKF